MSVVPGHSCKGTSVSCLALGALLLLEHAPETSSLIHSLLQCGQVGARGAPLFRERDGNALMERSLGLSVLSHPRRRK